MSPVGVNAFANAARAVSTAEQAAGADAPLLTTKKGVHAVSARRADWAFKSTHRQVIARFLNALKQEYGDGIAAMAREKLAAEIPAGKPLTARKVNAILSEANALAQAQVEFLAGKNLEDGKESGYSLERALDVWLQKYAVGTTLSQEDRAALRKRVFEEVVSMPLYSAKQLFEAVSKGDTPQLRALHAMVQSPRTWQKDTLAQIASARCTDAKLNARLAHLETDQQGRALQDGEGDRFRRFFRKQLFRLCLLEGRTAPPGDEAVDALFDKCFGQFALQLGALDEAKLAPEVKDGLRFRLINHDGQNNPITQAALADAIADAQNRAANAALTERLLDTELVPAARQAMREIGMDSVADLGESSFKGAFMQQVRDALRWQAQTYPQPPRTENEVRETMNTLLAEWKGALAATRRAPDAANPEAANSWLRAQLFSPEAVDRQYFRGLPAYLKTAAEHPLQPLLQASVSVPELEASLMMLQAHLLGGDARFGEKRSRDVSGVVREKISGALTDLYPELLSPIQKASEPKPSVQTASVIEAWQAEMLPVEDISARQTEALYRALDGLSGAALKARLSLEAREGRSEAAERLDLMRALHAELANRLGLEAGAAAADFERFDVVATREQLPLPVRPIDAPRYSGDIELPGLHKGAAFVAALGAQSEYFVERLANAPNEMLRLLRRQAGVQDERSMFEKDVRRGNLFVGERQISHGAPGADTNEGTRNAARAAYEDFAHFLTGTEAAFADLAPEQQREVFILAGLFCHQGPEKLVDVGVRAAFTPSIDLLNGKKGNIWFMPRDQTREICMGKNAEGDFVVRYQMHFSFLTLMPQDADAEPVALDENSGLDVRGEVALTQAELRRVAQLPWERHLEDPEWIPPRDWFPRIEARLDGNLHLQKQTPIEAGEPA